MAFKFSDEFRTKYPDAQQKWVQVLLRAKGWIVPNYELPPDLQATEILRVVVRENTTATMVDRLVADLVSAVVHAVDVLGFVLMARAMCSWRLWRGSRRRTRRCTRLRCWEAGNLLRAIMGGWRRARAASRVALTLGNASDLPVGRVA